MASIIEFNSDNVIIEFDSDNVIMELERSSREDHQGEATQRILCFEGLDLAN